MTRKRPQIALGAGVALAWALLVVWSARRGAPEPLGIGHVARGLAPPGAVLALMIGRLAQRRFHDDAHIDGQRFAPGTPGEIDQRVLTNTVEQIMLALCLWPFAAHVLGGQVLVALGWSFVAARLLFWGGYHLAPPLRALGFAATFYTTVVAALWALAVAIAG